MESFNPSVNQPPEEKPARLPECVINPESIKDSELEIGEDAVEPAKAILLENGISSEERLFIARLKVENGWVPATYLLNIQNENGEDADFERTMQAADILKQNRIHALHSVNPTAEDISRLSA